MVTNLHGTAGMMNIACDTAEFFYFMRDIAWLHSLYHGTANDNYEKHSGLRIIYHISICSFSKSNVHTY